MKPLSCVLSLVFALFSAAHAQAQSVTLNGAPVGTGTIHAKNGDKVVVTNDTENDVEINLPNGNTVILKPGGEATYVLQGGGTGPLTIKGDAGTFEFDIG